MRGKLIRLILAGVAVSTGMICLATAGCRRSGQTGGTLHLSLILDEKSEWHIGAARWKEIVEAESGGRYTVKIAPRASLSGGKQSAELEMVQSGVLHASLESTILLSTLDKAFSAFSLPWLFDDYEHAARVCDGPLGATMLKRLESVKLTGLAYGTNGFRQLTNNRRPIAAPEDFKGLKVRVPAISMYIDLFRNFGADPSQMDFGELLQAIQTGAMDGQENPLHVIRTTRLWEMQKYLTLLDYSYDPLVLCMNADFFNSVPAADREMFRKAAIGAMKQQRETVAANEKDHLEWLKQHMAVNRLTREQTAPFREIQKKLYTDYAANIGNELVNEFVRESQRLRAEDAETSK
ncbi:MAG TPA: DctP family TRAP transporter solute-binding subunit [Candidatus Brocadiia bacterium]|nr:DctP family TRAP transporter solute-binding subunit [Candidatus Brocadiia bacterium]